MPHCIPQNEQCVLTSVSDPRAAFAHPPGGSELRVGPKASASRSTGRGGVATVLFLDAQLGGRERRALARRTEILPRAGRPVDAVVEPELRQDAAQVVDLHARGKTPSAARARAPFVLRS